MKFKQFIHHEFYDDQKKPFWGDRAAGVLVYCPSTQRFLLGLRSPQVREGNTWGIFGGAAHEDEPLSRAARREMEEEIGYDGEVVLYSINVYRNGNFKYHNFLGVVPDEFKPRLDWENTDAKWFKFDEFPKNLHFGLKNILPIIKEYIIKESLEYGKLNILNEEVTLDLDSAYDIFYNEYMKSTGKAWDKEKFLNRAHNWKFYGDQNGFVAIRPQNSGFYKLVASAGAGKSKVKGLNEIVSLNLPLWGLVTKDIGSILVKKGFRVPNFIERQLLKKLVPKLLSGNNTEIKEFTKDGGIKIYSPDIGEVVKYFIGSPEYWKKLYSMKHLWNK